MPFVRPVTDMPLGVRVAVANVDPAPIAAACLLPILEPANVRRRTVPAVRCPSMSASTQLSLSDSASVRLTSVTGLPNGLADTSRDSLTTDPWSTSWPVEGLTSSQAVHRSHLEIVGRPVDEGGLGRVGERVDGHCRLRAAGADPGHRVTSEGWGRDSLPVQVLVPGDGLAAVVARARSTTESPARRPPWASDSWARRARLATWRSASDHTGRGDRSPASVPC